MDLVPLAQVLRIVKLALVREITFDLHIGLMGDPLGESAAALYVQAAKTYNEACAVVGWRGSAFEVAEIHRSGYVKAWWT